METKSLCGMSASWDRDTCSERQRSYVMWSRVFIVNERWRGRGICQVVMESLFHNKIKCVKSWVRGKGKLPYRQVLPRLKYAVKSHVMTRLTVRLTLSVRVTGWVAIHELRRMWKEAVVELTPPLAWRDWGKVWEIRENFSLKKYEVQVLLMRYLCCHMSSWCGAKLSQG